MKYFTAKLLCALLGLTLLAGCESTDSNKAAMGNSTKVALLFGPPTKPYSEIATLSVLKVQPSGNTWQNAIQQQAAARGADAVLIDTSTLDNNATAMVSGKAIRYQ